MDYHNPALHDATKSYVIAAINLIREQALTESNQNDLDDQSFFFAKLAASDRLRDLSEYKHCLQTLTADGTFSNQLRVVAGPRGGPRSESADANGLMLQFVDLGLHPGQLTFNEALFEREYADLEKAYYDSGIEFNALAPLNGFLPSGPICLSDGIEIIELQEEEIAPATNQRNSRSSADAWSEKPYAVSIKYSLPKAIGQAHVFTPQHRQADDVIRTAVNEQIAEVVTALRLCGIESVYVAGVLHKTSKWSMGQSRPFPGQFQPEIRFSMPVDSEWLQRFAEFWKTLQADGVKKRKFLVTAIRRFGYAHERYRTEDKIIDLLIAAEALLLSDSSYTGELKYRLSQRTALFLAATSDDRRIIFNRMGVAYDLRSAVAHGGNYKKQLPKKNNGIAFAIEEFVWQIHEYVRWAILEALKLAELPDAPFELVKWDELLFPKPEVKSIE